MQKDGKYIYCIIGSSYDCNFGPIGVGGNGDLVTTIGFDGLCMVVSDHSLSGFEVNPENILAHQGVIQEVMKEFNSVLPLRFGLIAATPDEIRNLLSRRYSEFMELLRTYENKVEVNVRAAWKNIGNIFKEIDDENPAFVAIRLGIEKAGHVAEQQERMTEAGLLVEQALSQKKEIEADALMTEFKKAVFESKENKNSGDADFFNAAFLINSGREKEIDNIMAELGEKYKDRVDFTYTSPLPVYNFINLTIFPERWE